MALPTDQALANQHGFAHRPSFGQPTWLYPPTKLWPTNMALPTDQALANQHGFAHRPSFGQPTWLCPPTKLWPTNKGFTKQTKFENHVF
jgi:hypothetical protein